MKEKLINLKSNKAITLIALVITIIVLLILAGVTIVTLTGDNGLLTKAGEARNTNIGAEGLEKIQLAVMASQDKDGINTTLLANNLRQINGLTDTNNQAITEITLPKNIMLNNIKYKIKKDGTVKKALLPIEYEQVEYIESSGTQYIDTEYIFENNKNHRVKIGMCVKNNKHEVASGCEKLDGGYIWNFAFGVYNYIKLWHVTTTNIKVVDVVNNETFYNIDMEHKDGTFIVKLDDSIKYSGKMNFSSCGMSYTLFADNTSNLGVNQFFNGRINYCIIYCNDVCVRNLIPCYSNVTGTIGMYDTVEGKFYTNQGTGTFGYETEDGTYVAPTNN